MGSPRDRRSSPEQAGLDTTLRFLAQRVEFPPTPDLWPGIERRLLTDEAPDQLGWRRSWIASPRPWRFAAVVIVLLIVLATSLALVPELRRAVADRLGLSGVIIRFVDEPPALPTAPAGARLDLGRPVSMEEAVEDAGFPLQAPIMPELGTPASVYITYGSVNPMVSFVYPANDLLPASRFTGVGALLTQFEGSVERGLIAKGLLDESAIRLTRVNEAPGFWIDGAAHTFMYLDPADRVQSETYRLAGNVLLWEVDGVTYRLESELTRDEAVAIAESMRPVSLTGTN